MVADDVRLDRKTLYHLVWSAPTSQLAKDYGLSDVAIGKMCRALGIPKPERGYWARLRHGKLIERPPLPPAPEGAPTEVVLPSRAPTAQRPRPSPSLSIPIPARLEDAHRLVVPTAAALEKKAPSETDGLVSAHEEGVLAIEVSPTTVKRALLLFDTLIKALEARGHRVTVTSGSKPRTLVTIAGESVAVRLRERVRQTVHRFTAEERKRESRETWFRARPFDYKPSGQFRLQIAGPESGWVLEKWSDGRKRLEERLGEIVASIEATVDERREQRLRRAEEQRRSEEESRRRAVEKTRFEDLTRQAAHWHQANEIRTYLQAVEQAAPTEERTDALRDWLAWAYRMADQLDPLRRSDSQTE